MSPKKKKKEEKIKNPIEGFGNPDFKIKGTEFSITKLAPMKGFKMTEFIRVNLIRSANSFETSDDTAESQAALFFKAVIGMDIDVVEHIRKELFQEIQFKTADVALGWVDLKDSMDMAFQDFEPINIYEVLVRVFFRDRVTFPRHGKDFKIAESRNIDSVFSSVLLNRLVSIDQLHKTGIGYDDILDLNELLLVKNENEYRSYQANKEE